VKEWLVAGAVVEDQTGLLLVQNRRRDGRIDWSPPGGVVDPGETVLGGLTREVREETGLTVTDWSDVLYEIVAEAPDMGWNLRVVVHRALEWEGEVRIDDPDGIVIDARYVEVDCCNDHLAGSPQWVRDPLGAWLAERWDAQRSFRYLVHGRSYGDLRVTVVP
jgi:8-oxo-dGTP diphosphatase